MNNKRNKTKQKKNKNLLSWFGTRRSVDGCFANRDQRQLPDAPCAFDLQLTKERSEWEILKSWPVWSGAAEARVWRANPPATGHAAARATSNANNTTIVILAIVIVASKIDPVRRSAEL